VVPDVGPFALDLHQSDAHAQADGRHAVRVKGGTILGRHVILGRHASGAFWSPVHATDVALRDNATTFVEVSAIGEIVSNQTGFTSGAQKLYAITVASGNVTAIDDWRFR
jgi:hypothetical protein